MSGIVQGIVWGPLSYSVSNTFVNWHLKGRIDQLEQRLSKIEEPN
jgi:hypothetical protein